MSKTTLLFAEFIAVVAVPLNVVAVIVFPNAEIPVSTYKAVPAKPPFERVPIKYNVEAVSVVVAIVTAEVPEPTVAHETVPEPLVWSTWLAVPSVTGNVNEFPIETAPV